MEAYKNSGFVFSILVYTVLAIVYQTNGQEKEETYSKPEKSTGTYSGITEVSRDDGITTNPTYSEAVSHQVDTTADGRYSTQSAPSSRSPTPSFSEDGRGSSENETPGRTREPPSDGSGGLLPPFIQALYTGLQKTIAERSYPKRNLFLQSWELLALRGKQERKNGSYHTIFDLSSITEKRKFKYVELVYEFPDFKVSTTHDCNFTCCNEYNECENLMPVAPSNGSFLKFLHFTRGSYVESKRTIQDTSPDYLTFHLSSCNDSQSENLFATTIPLLVLYPSEELAQLMQPFLRENRVNTLHRTLRKHRKRSVNGMRRKRTNTGNVSSEAASPHDTVDIYGGKCRLFPHSASGEDLGWKSQLLEPARIDLGFCSGVCEVSEMTANAFFRKKYLQKLSKTETIRPNIPAPCCVPKSLLPQTLVFEENGVIKMTTLPDIKVDSCECV